MHICECGKGGGVVGGYGMEAGIQLGTKQDNISDGTDGESPSFPSYG